MIYDEYVNYSTKYSNIYGKKTVVLMEVGGFYEMYGVHNENETSGAPLCEIGNLLNVQVSRKNKNIQENSKANPNMACFPSHSVKKYIDIFIANNYTVVVVNQTSPPPSPTRKVASIISPSTYIDNITNYNENILLVIYLEKIKQFSSSRESIIVAYTSIDISTGRTISEETSLSPELVYGELVRINLQLSPKEIVYISKDEINIDIYSPEDTMTHNKLGGLSHCFTLLKYQNEVLSKVFPDTGLLSKIEYINMESQPFLVVSFVYMVQFVYEHNEAWVSRIKKPIHNSHAGPLRLFGDASKQLSLWGNKKCLADLLNNCVTHIGKRYLQNRLIHPTSDKEWLNEQYSTIDMLLKTNLFIDTRDILKDVCDIERMFHKETITPAQLLLVHTSICCVSRLKTLIDEMGCFDSDMLSFMDYVKDTFSFDKTSKCLTRVVYDNIFSDIVKLDKTDKEGFIFTTTYKRAAMISRDDNIKIHTAPYNKTHVRVFEEDYFGKNARYCSLKREYKYHLNLLFTNTVDVIFEKYSPMISYCISFIEKYDFHSTNAYNAIRFKYNRPLISGTDSHIIGTQIRHPIIERIQQNVPYIPNDVILDKDNRGKLIFGINSSGKSSLMKSVGLVVIMAQSGMFVPATSFDFFPYDSIFTRIVSNDNIYKAQSSFTTEMIELRNILNYAGKRSLIIGDELCSGTESVSAVSLVASGIISLIEQNKSSFMLATHLHELTKIECVNKLPGLKIHHLSVRYDDFTNTIYYDRLLCDGPSNTLYGLEVCKSLDMPASFLHRANKIRQGVMCMPSEFVVDSPSRYNKKVYKDRCKICNNIATEVHHIKFQKDADASNMIGSQHKNVIHNLVAVCYSCHLKTHLDKLSIYGYVSTNKGTVLDYKYETLDKFNDVI
jgi:DNA mismatch repair protein MutS